MKKIMVVDDDSDLIFTVRKGLESASADYEIISAGSGRKCLELLRNNEIPDLILLDIMMPEMSGWKVFDKLKNNPLWRNIPVFFLTARTDEVAKNSGGFLGDDYIEKPFNIEELKNRIDKFLK